MSSPQRKQNHTPSISFKEEAEKTANFLPIIQTRNQNATANIPSTSSFSNTPSEHQAINPSSQMHHQLQKSKCLKIGSEEQPKNAMQKRISSNYHQDLLEGIEQQHFRQNEILFSKDFSILSDPTININYSICKKSNPNNQISDKHKQGYNLYNYGYQVKSDRDYQLNSSYEVDINNDNINNNNNHSYRIKSNLYPSFNNASLLLMSNQSKYRSQSCKRKVTDPIMMDSIDFNNQSYSFTPSSAPHGQMDTYPIMRSNSNQAKTLSYNSSNNNNNNNNNCQNGNQETSQKRINFLQSQPNVKEQSPSKLSQNPFDPLKEEIQIHFETDGCRMKYIEELTSSGNSDSKRDYHFPQGFFVQTPTASKRRTIRLNQNIYQTPLDKKQQQQIQNFSNINEYQFTFGDDDVDASESKNSFDFYHQIQSSKQSKLIMSQQSVQNYAHQDINQKERIHQTQIYNQNEKQKEFLNQQITKNDVCRSIPNKASSTNQQRQDEPATAAAAAITDQITFGLFPMREYPHSSTSTSQNQSPRKQNQIIHTPLTESTIGGGVRKYQKPKSHLFKRIFEKMNSLIDEQKRMDWSSTNPSSPVSAIDRGMSNSVNTQDILNINRSHQSSPKSKQYKPTSTHRRSNVPILLEPLQNNSSNQDDQSINKRYSQDNSFVNGSTFQNKNQGELSGIKDLQDLSDNQVFLSFQKKKLTLPISINGQQQSLEQTNKMNSQYAHLQSTQIKKHKSSNDQQHDTSIEISLNGDNQQNDRLNKWLQEHNQFKQSSISDYQQYVGITCFSMSPKNMAKAKGISPFESESSSIQGNTVAVVPTKIINDKNKLYKNVLSQKQNLQIGSSSDIYAKGSQFVNSSQSSTTTPSATKQNSLNQEKRNKQNKIQPNQKLNSATDFDNQNKNFNSIFPSKKNQQKNGTMIKKQSSLQIKESNKHSNQEECNQKTPIIQSLRYERNLQENIIQDLPIDISESSHRKIQKQKQGGDISLSKKNSQKEKRDIQNITKNFGPWVNENDDDNTAMEQIIKNQNNILKI